jgi:nucleoside-diphosphate-sugar epimerase
MRWDNKTVLVTGGASFISSHLVDKLVDLNAQVRIADDFSSGKLKNLEQARDRIEILKGDLRDLKFADKALRDVHIVFHLAAAHGGRAYISTHGADCASNLALDTTVFWRASVNSVDKVVFASSACVYPDTLQEEGRSITYLKEDMVDVFTCGKACADEEYGWAKLMGEMTLRAYHEQYELGGVSCRIYTAYGPRENETHAIMALIARAFIRQDPFIIWGPGTQTRNFTYVSDVVEGLIRAAEKVNDASAVNIGQDKLWSINETIEAVFRICDWHPGDVYRDLNKPVGVFNRVADTTRSQEILGWKPRVDLEDGLKRTIDWYFNTHDVKVVKRDYERLIWER